MNLSNYKKWGLVLGCALVTFLLWGMAHTTGPHMATTPCAQCHLAKDVTPVNASMLVASQERLCATCHAQAILMSHPSGFAPKRPLAKEYPLDWKGDLTCSSCHNIHGTGIGLMRTGSSGEAFCLACHDKGFFDKMPDHGASLQSFGHLEARGTLPSLDLDSFSLQCMTCHDEQADMNQVGIDTSGLMRHKSSSMNHPIGKSYQAASAYGGYRPIDQLPTVVILPNGRIGCISCHVGYSKEHGGLVASKAGSELCLICHDL
ncbi:MAG: cytochrome c3 family protein [Magnetococcales bacterium]|nr:cytochrome c3 family protein [Magnetococcales bacterium]MBF0151645.1 cytochrome c3 family protein [Magnetococcales bacterium]MBF0174797.1 cytochrome c3 family protein [Magnetococcales bacterium]MBF0346058.1 cytochrome c3 family protein [Magnetococcales bacterium]MBF0632638.1 cytochrome c3 family protein [Magnetococcales bacterium]